MDWFDHQSANDRWFPSELCALVLRIVTAAALWIRWLMGISRYHVRAALFVSWSQQCVLSNFIVAALGISWTAKEKWLTSALVYWWLGVFCDDNGHILWSSFEREYISQWWMCRRQSPLSILSSLGDSLLKIELTENAIIGLIGGLK